MEVDWRNPLDRAQFDKSLKGHKDRRLFWTPMEKTVWVVQIFLLQLLLIAAMYGVCAYNLVNNEQDLKRSVEEKINKTGEVGGFNITYL